MSANTGASLTSNVVRGTLVHVGDKVAVHACGKTYIGTVETLFSTGSVKVKHGEEWPTSYGRPYTTRTGEDITSVNLLRD